MTDQTRPLAELLFLSWGPQQVDAEVFADREGYRRDNSASGRFHTSMHWPPVRTSARTAARSSSVAQWTVRLPRVARALKWPGSPLISKIGPPSEGPGKIPGL